MLVLVTRSLCLTFLAAALLAPAAHADDGKRRVHAGLLVGINISDAFGDECTLDCDLDLSPLGFEGFDPAATLRTSDHVTLGAFLTLQLRGRWGLRVEGRLSIKGVKAQHGAPVMLFDNVDGMDVPRPGFINYTLEHDMRYLQVPVLVQMDIPYDGRFQPHLTAGVGLGYLWTAESTGDGDIFDAMTFSDIGDVTGDGDTSDAAGAFDMSVIVGADMVFPLARGSLEVGVRYELSVLNSLDGAFANELVGSRTLYQPVAASPDPAVELSSGEFVAEGLRNSILSVMAGYRF